MSYPFWSRHPRGRPVQTLSSGRESASATSTSVPVANASILDLSVLPTWILVGNSLGPGQEIIRVCSTTGTTGPQTLTACYDGRGIAGSAGNICGPGMARRHDGRSIQNPGNLNCVCHRC